MRHLWSPRHVSPHTHHRRQLREVPQDSAQEKQTPQEESRGGDGQGAGGEGETGGDMRGREGESPADSQTEIEVSGGESADHQDLELETKLCRSVQQETRGQLSLSVSNSVNYHLIRFCSTLSERNTK